MLSTPCLPSAVNLQLLDFFGGEWGAFFPWPTREEIEADLREFFGGENRVCSIITGHLCGGLAASAMQNLSGQIALRGSFLALHVQSNPRGDL